MLAIKTVLADTDDIPTLIFDEIDTGISGRTAQKVSEKLSYIAEDPPGDLHHPSSPDRGHGGLPILRSAKSAAEGRTVHQDPRAGDGGSRREELARLLGGAEYHRRGA